MNPPQVYPPAEDTFLLLGAATSFVQPTDRVLEVGCGSGFIAAQLAPFARVIASDINPHAVRMAREAGVETVRADLLSGIRGPFDVILFNPPYLPTHPGDRCADWLEYALDGGGDGTEVTRRFIAQVGDVLAPGGKVLILVSSLSHLPRIHDTLRGYGFEWVTLAEYRMEGETLSVLLCTRTPSG
ncbi:MAG: class I SAM-dependent methyltransferase [Methanolinea sp.]|nr:class I SAM-dependent methyltransferase [Methanolinea sp.]